VILDWVPLDRKVREGFLDFSRHDREH
jgi:hypothetical protein